MSVVRRTLVAVPVAIAAIAMFAATSQMEWGSWADDDIDIDIVTDDQGEARGEAVVIVESSDVAYANLMVRVFSEDARRSLRLDPGEDMKPERVRNGVMLWRNLPEDCEEEAVFPAAEPVDGDPQQAVLPPTCTVRVPLEFDGRRSSTDLVNLRVEVGDWGPYEPDSPIEVRVDFVD